MWTAPEQPLQMIVHDSVDTVNQHGMFLLWVSSCGLLLLMLCLCNRPVPWRYFRLGECLAEALGDGVHRRSPDPPLRSDRAAGRNDAGAARPGSQREVRTLLPIHSSFANYDLNYG